MRVPVCTLIVHYFPGDLPSRPSSLCPIICLNVSTQVSPAWFLCHSGDLSSPEPESCSLLDPGQRRRSSHEAVVGWRSVGESGEGSGRLLHAAGHSGSVGAQGGRHRQNFDGVVFGGLFVSGQENLRQ
ncbi:hypothetical protein INR49_019069 [Caranx melampygus]|nr:hypothetical protein INR49_002838 [Caranx melampygus]KAG7219419.1 hypothetical protein INR49_019069 [Caranx melampygus]